MASVGVTLTSIEGGGNFWRTILWAAEAFRAAGMEVAIERYGTVGLDTCRRIGRGEADVSVTLACGAWMAAAGRGAYQGEHWPVRGLALVAHPGHCLFSVVSRDCGIASFRDIAERRPALRLCVPEEDYITGRLVDAIFRAYGVRLYQDIEMWGGWLETSFLRVTRLIGSGQADGMIRESSRLGPVLATTAVRDMVALSLDRDVAENLSAEFGTPMVTLPPRTVRGQTAPVLTLDVTGYPLIVSAAMAETLAYRLARALNECSPHHWIAEDIFYSPRHAPETMVALHPGAAKYYREIGVLQ